jgi:hypothetical protein
MNPLLAKPFSEGGKSHAPRLSVHLDRYRVLSSNVPSRSFDKISLVTVRHPPYNPDLAPSDFWLFGYITATLRGRVFNDVYEFLEAVLEFLNEIHPSELQPVFTTRSNE